MRSASYIFFAFLLRTSCVLVRFILILLEKQMNQTIQPKRAPKPSHSQTLTIEPGRHNALHTPQEKLAFNIPEVCAATGVGRTTVYEAIKAGALKSIMVGGRRLVRREALANWLDGQSGSSPGNGRP